MGTSLALPSASTMIDRAVLPAQDEGGLGHDDGVLQRAQHQAHAQVLAGPEQLGLVVELGLT